MESQMSHLKMNILDVGCGKNKIDGAVGVDRFGLPGVDVIANIEFGLPFHSATFDRVECHHVIEHLNDGVMLMREIHRVLKEEGILKISFPLSNTAAAWDDPTHKRPYSIKSMKYFCPEDFHNYYFDFSFNWYGVKFHTGYGGGIFKKIIESFLNLHESIGRFFSRHPRLIIYSFAEPVVLLQKPKDSLNRRRNK